MGKKVFYKPELTQQKAHLIARCISHCLTCEGIGFSQEEQTYLLRFCNHVNEADFVDSTLKRIEAIKRVKAVEPLKGSIEKPTPNAD